MPRIVNRAALVVRPRGPYIRWAASLGEDGHEDAHALANMVSVYLVGEDPDGEQESAPLHQYYERLFEAELEAWWQDESRWPQDRSLEVFLEWFDVVAESLVVDLETSTIVSEEW